MATAATLIVAGLWWARELSNVTLKEHAALVSLSDRVQQRLTAAHLWLEEGISGDEHVHLESSVLVPIDEALGLMTIALEGGTGPRGEKMVALRSPKLRQELYATRDRIVRFRAFAERRWEMRHSGSEAGSLEDRRFDALFEETLAHCEALARQVQAEVTRGREDLARSYLAFIAIVVIAFAIGGTQLVRSRRELDARGRELERKVSERTAALEKTAHEAQAANRAKSAFLAGMSHEIRTPLNAVIGMTELLTDTELQAEQRELVATIHTSGQALLSVISDVLDYSKIESGKLSLERVSFDLRDSLEEALEIVALGAASKGLELTYAVEEGTGPGMMGDPGRLRQVFVNLLTNATKFTERGSVHIELRGQSDPALGRVLRCAVTDTGIGIRPEAFERLFKSFSQVDDTTTRRYGGTGLGLVICKQLVDLMGGRIGVESTAGLGSTFWFVIPHEVVSAPERRWRDAALPFLGGRHALVVDDQVANLRLLALLLGRWGMRVTSATSARQALDLLGAGLHVDVALLDINMPEVDGWTLARHLRSAHAAVPLVVLSSVFDEPPRDLEVVARLHKPIKQARLHDVLAALFGAAQSSPPTGAASADPQRLRLIDARTADRLPRCILLAEDHPFNRRLASGVLRKLGYEPRVVTDGREAVDAVAEGGVDLVLMDVQMPELDGLSATLEIRARHSATRPWIIGLTANAAVEDRSECLAAGMNDYLPKPLRVRDLVAALERSPGPCTAALAAIEVDIAAEDLTPLLDLAALKELRALELLHEIVTGFDGEAPQMLNGIERARAEGNRDAWLQSAHRLKGSAASVGARALSQLARDIEMAVREGRDEAAAATTTRLAPMLEATLTALRREATARAAC